MELITLILHPALVMVGSFALVTLGLKIFTMTKTVEQ
jgi:hypothetical protein